MTSHVALALDGSQWHAPGGPNVPLVGAELKVRLPTGGCGAGVCALSVNVAVHAVELLIWTVVGAQLRLVVVGSTAVTDPVPVLSAWSASPA